MEIAKSVMWSMTSHSGRFACLSKSTMILSDFSGQYVGPYRLVSPLNSGATSAVYRAVHTERPGKYAIKCISKSELTPKQLSLRMSEVFHHQLVTGCSPHVLRLQEVIDEELYMFIVSKLYDGDLSEAIWSDRLYQRNEALIRQTFLDIIDGVYACHSKGVFHRDLKPANILCREGGTSIRIADFGLATRKRICRGSRCGTLDYMSPGQPPPFFHRHRANMHLEQWTEGPIVYYPSRADIWSLGIILVNLVTGRRPWDAAHPSDEHYRAFLEDKDYLYHTLSISWSLNQVLKWILCPDPWERPQILQIRLAILNVDTFYRAPCPPMYDAVEWSKRMALIQ